MTHREILDPHGLLVTSSLAPEMHIYIMRYSTRLVCKLPSSPLLELVISRRLTWTPYVNVYALFRGRTAPHMSRDRFVHPSSIEIPNSNLYKTATFVFFNLNLGNLRKMQS